MHAEEILSHIVSLFTEYLDELNLEKRNDFIHGEMTAYVETLEIIQALTNSSKYNLDYNIEEKYKI